MNFKFQFFFVLLNIQFRQGLKWIKQKYEKIIIVQLTQTKYLDIIEKAIPAGDVVLLENIGESVDAVLDTLLSRNLIKKGKAIKIGDKEVDFNPKFKLILQTKLANPHYKPEMQAQTTLINFTVTRDGCDNIILVRYNYLICSINNSLQT